jgi:hypothetical protein
MRIARIPSRILTQSKRIYYRNKNSSPYLSGDLFAGNSDISFFGPRFDAASINRKDLDNAQVIFCPSHELDRLNSEYGKLIRAKVLILGNSDRDFESSELEVPGTIKHVFAQNLLNSSRHVSVLPLGIENLRLGRNGELHLFREALVSQRKLNQILIGPFSPTHQERKFFFEENLLGSTSIVKLSGRLSPDKFAKISAEFKFVAAPRGNGLDTHRFWEALYRGSYPVVLQSVWSSQIKELGIPLVTVPEWNVKSFSLIDFEMSPLINPNQIPALWWPFWRDKIKKAI